MPTNGNGNCQPLNRYRQTALVPPDCGDCAPGTIGTNVNFTGAEGTPGRPGPQGPPGVTGSQGIQGFPAYTLTACAFVMPARQQSVLVPVEQIAPFGIGQQVFVSTAGYFYVSDIDTLLFELLLVNTWEVGNAPPGTNIVKGQTVVGAGPRGDTGAPAWTNVAQQFVVPPLGQSVTVKVAYTDWMTAGAFIAIANAQNGLTAGYLQITQVLDRQTVVLTNVTGFTYVTGPEGPAGPRGTRWFIYRGPPPFIPEAIEGDAYMDVITGSIWVFDGAAFVPPI